MKLFPILFVLVAAFACNLMDRINLDTIIGHAEQIRDGQIKFYIEQRRYGSLQELIDAGLASKNLTDGRDAGFFIQVEARGDKYSLSIFPDYTQDATGSNNSEQLSIYCDETGVLRGSVTPDKRADKTSDALNPKH